MIRTRMAESRFPSEFKPENWNYLYPESEESKGWLALIRRQEQKIEKLLIESSKAPGDLKLIDRVDCSFEVHQELIKHYEISRQNPPRVHKKQQ